MKVHAKETVFSARYFKVIKKTIERNGHTFTKEIVERNPIVMIIPYTKDNVIYMERQFRDAMEDWMLECVAGTIEGSDDPLETAKRELQEEAGLTAKTWHKLGVLDLSANMYAKIHLFAATDLTEGASNLEKDEQIEIMKMPLDTVVAKIYNGEMTIGTHVGAILLFKHLREEGKL